jgi:hypothetical protein
MNSAVEPLASSSNQSALLRRARWALAVFIAGLVFSGLTAFPLAKELDVLASLISPGGTLHAIAPLGLQHWILLVRDGLADTYARYPWVGYGTDWLAFGHIIIALFFMPAWRDPERHEQTLRIGLLACSLVIPLALIAGPVRGIPFYWRLIDCSFGVFGSMPLLIALHAVRTMRICNKIVSSRENAVSR